MFDRSQDIWNFATALYRQPGVEVLCLTLQQRYQVNINLLMWCQWLQAQQLALTPSLLNAAETKLAGWDGAIVQPLRQVRQALKQQKTNDQFAKLDTLYRNLKRVELDAERVEYGLLAELNLTKLSRAENLSVGHNLRCYLQFLHIEELESSWISTLSQLPFATANQIRRQQSSEGNRES